MFNFVDSLMERRIRVAALIVVMVIGASIVISGYRWARPQNGGPFASLEEEIFFAAVPAIACVTGSLGQNLRIWSWAFFIFGVYGVYWITEFVAANDGSYMTRLYYSDRLLRLHLALALFGAAALAIVMLRKFVRGQELSRWKVCTGALLVPVRRGLRTRRLKS